MNDPVRRDIPTFGSATRLLHLVTLLLLWPACAPAAAGDNSVAALLQQAVAAACETPPPTLSAMADRIAGARPAGEKPLEMQGAAIGWERHFGLPKGDEIRVERVAPGGQMRSLLAEYHEGSGEGRNRPRLAAVADASCTIRTGRRLVYETDSAQAVAVEHLDEHLSPTGVRGPLNPPVPDGTDPGGIPVALVDAGVNYLQPEIARRLARGRDGRILGYDYWDLDQRPFDANPARSPFFPQRHGTKTASLLLREAPMVRLVPYRYPRPDMSRMAELIRDAAAAGVVVVNLSLGSDDRADWEAFATAARTHPDMLFVVSAGNNGRDIDREPVYPAALRLDNIITVTSSETSGELARGSNWGERSVDLIVPAERLLVMDFDGNEVAASGSSYAAVRISALAARLLAGHPAWRAPELKAAIFARVLPPLSGRRTDVARGFIPRPDKADRLPPLSADGELTEAAHRTIGAGELYDDPEAASRRGHIFEPTFAFFTGTAWQLGELRRDAKQAAAILAQCGIFIPDIDIRTLDGPDVFRYFRDSIGEEIVRRLALSKPTVYFVRDTLQVNAYDAEAIGKGNSAGRPALRYTLWVTEDTRDPGIALAHELSHILMDSGRHVDTPDNLMRPETASSNTRLTDGQCAAMVSEGTQNGLLRDAPGVQ